MGAKLTQSEAQFRVNKRCITQNCISENFVYITSEKTILKLKCNVCEQSWTATYCGFVTSYTGCPTCGGTKPPTQNEADEKIKQRCIDEKYQLYSNFKYNGKLSKINLICSLKHIFQTTYFSFTYQKSGCSICRNVESHQKQKLPIEIVNKNINQRCLEENCEIITKLDYKNNNTKINLKCLNCNYEWNVQYMNFVNSRSGCPECKKASQLEKQIKNLLDINKIQYIQQKSFDFIARKSLDFYLPEYNLAIECQGKQHFTPNSFGYNKSDKTKNLLYQTVIYNDKLKFEECKANGIKIIYFAGLNYQDNIEFYNDDNQYYNNIFTSETKLITKILENNGK